MTTTIETLRRRPDWDRRLQMAVNLYQRQAANAEPRPWNCALMAGNLVLAMTGTDVIASFRDEILTRESAGDFVEHNYGTLENATRRILVEAYKAKPANWKQARRGDVVLRTTREAPFFAALGICLGRGRGLFAGLREPYQLADLEPSDQIYHF